MSRTPQRFEEPKRDGKAVGGGVEGRTYGAIAVIASPFLRTRTAKNHAVLQILCACAHRRIVSKRRRHFLREGQGPCVVAWPWKKKLQLVARPGPLFLL